jgi:tRNA threonylcarbamoyladenosine biosynthesis protein TsaB
MKILCIDTAAERGLVAVACDGAVRASVRWRSAGRHGEELLGHIEAALSQASVGRAELSAIGVVTGPGGFTSLRVGLATAKGLALGLGLPIVGVSSLRVMARAIEASADSALLPVMKAYRGDVFAAAYVLRHGALEEIVPPRSGNPTDVLQEIREMLGDRSISIWNETSVVTPEALAAEMISALDDQGPADLAALEPQYLRASDARLPARPLRTMPESER